MAAIAPHKIDAAEEVTWIMHVPSSFGEGVPPATENDRVANTTIRRRYDRIAPVYDLLESLMELRFSRWRRELWSRLDGAEILEIGVGTGKNFRHYPPFGRVTAIDFSQRMLERACNKRRSHRTPVRLVLADVQELPYRARTFDAAIATFVFCSVPDPVLGLQEVRRVLRSGGKLLLLEHVLSQGRLLRRIMKRLAPLVCVLCGARIDRDTVHNVHAAGFSNVQVNDLALDIVKRIEASAP